MVGANQYGPYGGGRKRIAIIKFTNKKGQASSMGVPKQKGALKAFAKFAKSNSKTGKIQIVRRTVRS